METIRTRQGLRVLPSRRRAPVRTPPRVDAAGLARALAAALEGETRFDDGTRAIYATDGSNYRQAPIGVVIPRSLDDVVETVRLCREFGAPVLSRGGGTSLAGQCCNVAVVMDFSKYLRRIVEVDPDARTARVEPGVILDDLRAAAEVHHLTFAPDPSTHDHCTLGGMIGNNACGVHSIMGGRTADNVEELTVLTWDGLQMTVGATSAAELEAHIRGGGRRGQIYAGLRALRDRYADRVRARFPRIPRRVSGYNLDELLPENGFHVARSLVGSEGTLVTILEARVRLVHSPPFRALLVLGYRSIYEAADHIPEVMRHHPIGCEGIDDRLVADMKKKKIHPDDVELVPPGGGWLLVEFGGESQLQADAHAHLCMEALGRAARPPAMKLFDDKARERQLWRVRESGLGATARVPGAPDTWEGWEDSAVPPERLGAYLRELRALFDKHHYSCALYGHFGQGCVHTRIDFQLKTADGIRRYRAFMEEAADLVVRHGGSLSGEHGDGQSRAELLPRMFGRELVGAFREFKAIWDPDNKMNPGKITGPEGPYRIDENLRYGSDYDPPQVTTHFQFPDDHGSFSYATERCVGVGSCRREQGGTMCPSYMVTRDEQHSTRGRARMLFEMLQGDIVKDGWGDKHVKEALDLCLSCKGCKSDCPMNVDMATYKAEFLSHFYERHARPRAAFTIGLIPWWARLASLLPSVANALGRAPLVGWALKWAGGIATARRVPVFALEPFSEWFARRPRVNEGAPRVLLWPDTFNNYLHPQVARAAVVVLETAGFEVVVPDRPLCCGRPLYDYGMLDLAARQLRQILDALRPHLAAGLPVVGLEPSCLAVFRDELPGLLPGDEGAARLRDQSFLLSEFLVAHAPDFEPPKLGARALLHGHCHQKSLVGMSADEKMLEKIGVAFEAPTTGCCGMAGSFGFEAEHFDVSQAVGERVLLPAVRDLPPDALVIADGFSCKQMIEHNTDRRGLHLAEVLLMALEGAEVPPYPERGRYDEEREALATMRRRAKIFGGAMTIGAAAGLAYWLFRRRSG